MNEVSPRASTTDCAWCRSRRPERRGLYCSKRCRQTAFRFRRRASLGAVAHRSATSFAAASDAPMKFAYADPPYPGFALLYKKEPTYAGEVDHASLVHALVAGYPDGWALSTSSKTLRLVLPLCPPGARVCAWVKPIAANPRTYGLQSCWEPLIVFRGRQRRPGKRDWLLAQPARLHGSLIGRKPLAFCAFLFASLGAAAGDTLDDLFPGTGMISRAWGEFQRRADPGDMSPLLTP